MANVEPIYGTNKAFRPGNQRTIFHACQAAARKSLIGPETNDMKAVLNLSQSLSVIITDKCDKLDVTNGHSSSKASIAFYRQTARKLCKQSKVHRHLFSRDREPSRIPHKKGIQTVRKRKLRQV